MEQRSLDLSRTGMNGRKSQSKKASKSDEVNVECPPWIFCADKSNLKEKDVDPDSIPPPLPRKLGSNEFESKFKITSVKTKRKRCPRKAVKRKCDPENVSQALEGKRAKK